MDRDTEEVRFRHAATATLLAAFIACFSACGGDDGDGSTQGSSENEATVEGDAPGADVEVIEAWSDALREGDIDGAAGYFAIPSVTENGVLLRISNREDARLFNESLPCGAKLVRAEGAGDFTTATFELTERPGPGTCGEGTGARAQTAFVIEDGKITEWRRVGIGTAEPPEGDAV